MTTPLDVTSTQAPPTSLQPFGGKVHERIIRLENEVWELKRERSELVRRIAALEKALG